MKRRTTTALTKLDMAKRLRKELYIDKKNAKEIIDRVFDYIAEGLMDNRLVWIDGFGKFELRHRKAKMGYNHQTNEKMMCKPFNAVRFKSSTALRAAVRDTVVSSDADEFITS